MFGRKDNEEIQEETQTQQDMSAAANPAPASLRTPTAESPRPAMSPSQASPMQGRRPMEMQRNAPTRRPNPERDRALMGTEERKLTVGKGLSLSGEIAACDVLVVEGKVEAKLSDGKLLEITETGQFRGNVEIENADIAGRYDGDLTVHGRLTLRGTGRISGMVKYGELEVNAGGQIIGEMQVIGADGVATGSTSKFKNAAKFTASSDETGDEGGALFSRKTVNG